MDTLENMFKYWDKILLFVGIAGYFGKLFFDHKYKRKEIFFELYAKEKLDSFVAFNAAYYKSEHSLIYGLPKLKSGSESLQMDELTKLGDEVQHAFFRMQTFLDSKSYKMCQDVVLRHMYSLKSFIETYCSDEEPDFKQIIERFEIKFNENVQQNRRLLADAQDIFKKEFSAI